MNRTADPALAAFLARKKRAKRRLVAVQRLGVPVLVRAQADALRRLELLWAARN